MLLSVLLLIIGFVILVKGADLLVVGSASAARKFNISSLVIGLTVVAFGTSSPELIVSLLSAINERNDASFGNVIGSNNFNLFLILGTAGLIFPLVVKRDTIKYELPFSFFAFVLLYVLVNDAQIWNSPTSQLSRLDSIILLIVFVGFMYYILRLVRKGSDFEESEIKEYTLPISIGLSILGLVMLVGGGTLVVEKAVEIARYYNLSDKLIGLTILATGTSLPELATSAVAAYRKNTDIAIGNVVGSNVFNTTLILGVTGVIHPISYNPSLNLDMQVFGVGTIVLMIFMFTINQRKLDRWEAFLLFTGYLTYLIYQIFHDQPGLDVPL